MFHADIPQNDATAFIPADAAALLDDEFLNPAADDYLDRCLFDLRTAASDFRNQ
jgi:hypothetical protein